jgi:hypothetical protein
MGRQEFTRPSSGKPQNTETGKPALVEFWHNLWNTLTGQNQQEKSELRNNFKQKKEALSTQSRAARRNIFAPQSINTYSAWERMSPTETAQKIWSIFGDVSRVRIPRSNGRAEVATRRSDGLFYFVGKNVPCYLDKDETISKDIETKTTQEVQTQTQSKLNKLLPWNWFRDWNKKQEASDTFNADSIEGTRNLSGAAKKVVSTALQWARSGSVNGASHCTDWVDRVFKRATGWTVHGTEKCIYNSVWKIARSDAKSTGLAWRPAPREVLDKIRPWDHLMVQWRPGRTHSAIAIWEPKDGIITVASWPWSGSSRVETYDLWGLGRTKNVAWGVLRIQRPGYNGWPIAA